MESNKPFIKLFKTMDKFYFFDVNTNSIVSIGEDAYHELEDINNIESSKNKQIHTLYKRGYLRENDKNIKVCHPALPMVEKYMEGNLKQLILQVTQNCNLRCKYCVYSGSYINRTHTNKRMSFEVAKKAVDFYFLHNFNKDSALISFYGGEPLLEIDLIRKIVDYCEKLFAGKDLRFNMTTNATLFNDEIADFLYDHKFNLTISLDGPEEVQNNSRVFASNNQGTFECIMKNLKRIEERHSDYMENMAFNAVLDMKNDFKCSSNFFTYDFMKNALVTFTTLNENGNKEEIKYSEAFDINYRYELFKSYLKYIGRLNAKYVSKIIDEQVGSLKIEIEDKVRGPYNRDTICHPSGPCIPGAVRLFVTVEGVFYPCERVNEKCRAYVIGNVEDGFYIESIKQLLNVGALTSENCKNCWAIEYCNSCVSGIDEGDELSAEKRISRCSEIKESCELRFIEYCTLKEMGCRFE